MAPQYILIATFITTPICENRQAETGEIIALREIAALVLEFPLS